MKIFTKEIDGKMYVFIKHHGFKKNDFTKRLLLRETANYLMDNFNNKYNKKTGKPTGDNGFSRTNLVTYEEYAEGIKEQNRLNREAIQNKISELEKDISALKLQYSRIEEETNEM